MLYPNEYKLLKEVSKNPNYETESRTFDHALVRHLVEEKFLTSQRQKRLFPNYPPDHPAQKHAITLDYLRVTERGLDAVAEYENRHHQEIESLEKQRQDSKRKRKYAKYERCRGNLAISLSLVAIALTLILNRATLVIWAQEVYTWIASLFQR